MALKDSDLNKWSYKEHTEKKHNLLLRYFGTWLVIMSKFNKKLCYFDCFAGRGQYKNGEKGSPILALETICHRIKTISSLNNVKIFCFFIEKDKDNFENLKKVVENYKKENEDILKNVRIFIENDEFSNVTNKVLDNVKDNLVPSFFFIDPFGWKGVEFKTIKRILQINKCEVFINFMIDQVNRFFEDEKLFVGLDSLFGVEQSAKKISELIDDLQISREDALLKFYRDQLNVIAEVKYNFPFQMCDPNCKKSKYFLIHATNHWKGAETMKEIMYNEGTKGHFGYLGPVEGQMNLNDYSRENDIYEFLKTKYSKKKICFTDLIKENLNDKPYVEKNYRSALKKLLLEKKINVNPLGTRGGISIQSEITFI